ncbi:MAG: PAS domain S-box protein, partial [Acidobacteriota bacterium]|nr:PAS domain S-box protein [Acidobacteriota bacterium]
MTFRSASQRALDLRSVVDSLADGVVIAHSSGEFLVFNRAAEKMLGVGAVRCPPAEWSETYGCYLPDKKTLYPTEELPMLRAFRGEETSEALMYILNPANPAGLWISINARPLPTGDGDGQCGVIVFRDVTDEKRSRDRINRLSSAVEQAADVILITDAGGVIEYVNPAFESITGYSAGEALGESPSILNSGRHDAEFFSRMWRQILDGKVFEGVIANRRKDGEIFYTQQTISPIKAASGRISHFVSVGRDITSMREAEEQKSKMRFARAVQQRFYPSGSPSVKGFDISGAAYPADATGGDYFDYIPMPDGRSGVAVGDVSGHGFDSALLMSETRAYVRSLASADPDVGRVLTAANRVTSADIEDNRFITLMLVRFDPASRTLIYASAGHETGYILDRKGA